MHWKRLCQEVTRKNEEGPCLFIQNDLKHHKFIENLFKNINGYDSGTSYILLLRIEDV